MTYETNKKVGFCSIIRCTSRCFSFCEPFSCQKITSFYTVVVAPGRKMG